MDTKLKKVIALLSEDSNLYFAIDWYDEHFELTKLVSLNEENKGAEKFIEYVNRAKKYGAQDIIVKLYKKQGKGFKKTPETQIVISLDDTVKKAVELQGLEIFGGLEGFVSQKVSQETLKYEVDRLRNENQKLALENKNLTNLLSQTQKENIELRDKIKALDWTIKDIERQYKYKLDDLERQHKHELEDIERKNKNLERIIELAGSTVIKTVGLDKNDVLGLLGLQEQDDRLAENTDQIDNADVKVNIAERNPEKHAAYNALDKIHEIIEYNIENSPADNAINYATQLLLIIEFLHSDIKNFQQVLNLINTKQETNEKQVEYESEYNS